MMDPQAERRYWSWVRAQRGLLHERVFAGRARARWFSLLVAAVVLDALAAVVLSLILIIHRLFP